MYVLQIYDVGSIPICSTNFPAKSGFTKYIYIYILGLYTIYPAEIESGP